VLARDCDQSFRDTRPTIFEEKNSPGFGCSVSANIVQHVSNKQQFISPNLSDLRDAESAVSTYNGYQSGVREATSKRQDYGLENSTLSAIKSQ